jgi:hypothetical protein
MVLPLLVLLAVGSLSSGPSTTPPADDPDVHPHAVAADLVIIRHAQRLLASASRWDRRDTRHCAPAARRVSLYCALERATREVTGTFEHRGAVMQEARFALEALVPAAKRYEHRLMDFNNDPRTSFADVRRVLRLTRTRVEADLHAESQGTAQQRKSL